ncbi:MAG TPA: TIR domain-containing protein [Gemmataceae bacterium]|nr:TIR domain-containing protein [Gemmataceae bacterium]
MFFNSLLERVYRDNSDLVVVFLCVHYETKPWCGIEWRAIREIIMNKSDHVVMFVRLDNAKIQGVFSHDGYIDATRHNAVQAAGFILERVRLNELEAARS